MDAAQTLGDLLARIHRDGGHYIEEHGIEKAVADADSRIAELNVMADQIARKQAVDQPPPLATDRRPAWELVIEDAKHLYDEVRRHREEIAFTVKGKHANQTEGAIENQFDAIANPGLTTLVLADMAERDQVGRARYGVPLTAGNGRRHLVDAYQEALDLAVYLRVWLDEKGVVFQGQDAPDLDITSVKLYYGSTLSQLVVLRALIERGL